MIPEEINYPIQVDVIRSPYIVNKDIFNENLEKRKINKFDETKKHEGKIYIKNTNSYYGPTNTYKNIPKVNDIKFETNVQIGNLDELEMSQKEAENQLIEKHNELSNALLFYNTPKLTNEVSLNEHYALPYYDTTHEDKIIKIGNLKDNIIRLRKKLNINSEDVQLYVEIHNSTFPKSSGDIEKHLNENFYHLDKNVNATNFIYNNISRIFAIDNSIPEEIRGNNVNKM
jgi:hypothetical protein